LGSGGGSLQVGSDKEFSEGDEEDADAADDEDKFNDE
jgi:hypothetical protein